MDNETMTSTDDTIAADTSAAPDAPEVAQTLRVTIGANQVKALLRCAGEKDIRQYLNAVCIDTTGGNAVAVATNGTVLLAVLLPDRDDGMVNPRGQWIIPRDALKAVKPAKGWRGRAMPLEITCEFFGAKEPNMQGGAGFQVKGATTAAGETVDCGRFPDWRRVVPLKVSGELAQFNCELAGIFGDVAGDLGVTYAPIGHNGEAAGLVYMGEDAVGVIMPMRVDRVPVINARPDWIG